MHGNELHSDHNYNYRDDEATRTPCSLLSIRPLNPPPLPPHTHTKQGEHFLHITVLMCLTAACKKPSNLSKSRRDNEPKRTLCHTHSNCIYIHISRKGGTTLKHLCLCGCVRVNDFLHTASQLDALGLSALWTLSPPFFLFSLPKFPLHMCVYGVYYIGGINLYGFHGLPRAFNALGFNLVFWSMGGIK